MTIINCFRGITQLRKKVFCNLVRKAQTFLGLKALVFYCHSYYHISMKTTNLLTKTAVLAVCLGTAISCFAQTKDVAKGVSKGLFEAPRLTRGTVQRFVFPRSTVSNIRAGIATGKLDRIVTDATQLPISLATTPAAQALFNKTLVAGQPVEKEVLIMAAKEGAFYAPEIDAGRMIRQQILDITVLEEEGQQAIAQNIHAYIKNHTLKTLLLEELENYDIYNMALDLTDYFSLDKPFEEAAFSYTIRHPHQMNLNMRRLMYNPLVDDSAKNSLRYFLESEYIPLQEHQAFRAAIQTAHLQYKTRLNAAQEADVIKAQINYYQEVTTRLRNFIAKEHRRPKWNTHSTKEAELNEELEWIMFNDHLNKFPQILPFRQTLQTVYTQAPTPTLLSLDETVALFEEFVKTTHRPYPSSLRDKNTKGQVPFKQEETLWDSLEYWRIKNESAIHPLLAQILKKYPVEQ